MFKNMRNLREAVPVADYKSDDDEYAPFSGPGSSFTKKLYDIVDTAESTEIVCWAKDMLPCSVSFHFRCLPLLTESPLLIRWTVVRGPRSETPGAGGVA